MDGGQVVRVIVPQADRVVKTRPVVLLKQFPPYGDWLVCGISKSIDVAVAGSDIVLDEQHPDYALSRLNHPGVIRLGFLNAVSRYDVEGTMGRVSPSTYALLMERLIDHLRAR